MVAVPHRGGGGGGEVSDRKDKKDNVRLTDEQRIDWLRLIRSPMSVRAPFAR
jgi:hypothetical protein